MLTISGFVLFVLKTKIYTLIMQSIGSVRQWKTDDFESDHLGCGHGLHRITLWSAIFKLRRRDATELMRNPSISRMSLQDL